MKIYISLSTTEPAPTEQLERTLLNAVRNNWRARRQEFKLNPIDPVTGKRLTFDAWLTAKLAECRLSESKPKDLQIPVVVRLEMDINAVQSLLGLDKHHDLDTGEVKDMFAKWLTSVVGPRGWYVPEIKSSRSHGLAAFFRPLKYRPISPVPPSLYHFSQIGNLKRILAKGLIPKRGEHATDFMYPPRVHLLAKLDMEYVRDLSDAIFHHNAGQDIESMYHDGAEGFGSPIVVFEIDTSKLRKGTQFYRDPSVKDGVWTYTHIPGIALNVIHTDPTTTTQ